MVYLASVRRCCLCGVVHKFSGNDCDAVEICCFAIALTPFSWTALGYSFLAFDVWASHFSILWRRAQSCEQPPASPHTLAFGAVFLWTWTFATVGLAGAKEGGLGPGWEGSRPQTPLGRLPWGRVCHAVPCSSATTRESREAKGFARGFVPHQNGWAVKRQAQFSAVIKRLAEVRGADQLLCFATD